MTLPDFDRGDLKHFNEPAELLKALAHPVRLCIVRCLLRKKSSMFLTLVQCFKIIEQFIHFFVRNRTVDCHRFKRYAFTAYIQIFLRDKT
ncbi:hypothetical protein D3C74_125510 [compost metagenome]